MGASDSLKKLEEHKINDYLFWTVEQDELMEKLEIESFGIRKKLFRRRKEILEDHKKTMEEQDEKRKDLSEEDKKNIQFLLECWSSPVTICKSKSSFPARAFN